MDRVRCVDGPGQAAPSQSTPGRNRVLVDPELERETAAVDARQGYPALRRVAGHDVGLHLIQRGILSGDDPID